VHHYAQVLGNREKSEISEETSSYRQNELLLSTLCYKSDQQYEQFLTALDKTDQGHVRNAITGRTGEVYYWCIPGTVAVSKPRPLHIKKSA